MRKEKRKSAKDRESKAGVRTGGQENRKGQPQEDGYRGTESAKAGETGRKEK